MIFIVAVDVVSQLNWVPFKYKTINILGNTTWGSLKKIII